jgi:DnaJ-class molecular chaperone
MKRKCVSCSGRGWHPVQFFTPEYGYQILEDSCLDCSGAGDLVCEAEGSIEMALVR